VDIGFVEAAASVASEAAFVEIDAIILLLEFGSDPFNTDKEVDGSDVEEGDKVGVDSRLPDVEVSGSIPGEGGSSHLNEHGHIFGIDSSVLKIGEVNASCFEDVGKADAISCFVSIEELRLLT